MSLYNKMCKEASVYGCIYNSCLFKALSCTLLAQCHAGCCCVLCSVILWIISVLLIIAMIYIIGGLAVAVASLTCLGILAMCEGLVHVTEQCIPIYSEIQWDYCYDKVWACFDWVLYHVFSIVVCCRRRTHSEKITPIIPPPPPPSIIVIENPCGHAKYSIGIESV